MLCKCGKLSSHNYKAYCCSELKVRILLNVCSDKIQVGRYTMQCFNNKCFGYWYVLFLIFFRMSLCPRAAFLFLSCLPSLLVPATSITSASFFLPCSLSWLTAATAPSTEIKKKTLVKCFSKIFYHSNQNFITEWEIKVEKLREGSF